jgi:twinkle protein
MADITEIKRALSARATEVAEHLLPRGMRVGGEWCVGSTAGEPGQSLKVCLEGRKAGTWADFAADGESGDLIDLWCCVKHQELGLALNSIRAWLGIKIPTFDKPEKSWRRPQQPKCQPATSAVLDYLMRDRRLSAETIAAYRVGEAGRMMVFQSFVPDGDLALVKHMTIDRGPGGRRAKPPFVDRDCEPVLFGWQAIDPNAREVTITEGEIDAMTARDYGWPALSVPFGGGKGAKQAWIESEYDRFLRFETIYLALDMDKEGDAAAEEIATRLGRHRCRRVMLPCKDLNECRGAGIGNDAIRKCFEQAKTLDPPELQPAGAFSEDVIGLFWPKGGREPGYRLPFAGNAEGLTFRSGELTLWTGGTGAGKSQLLSHACVDWSAQGARICIASLEMSPAQLLKRMVKQAGNVERPTEEYIRAIMEWFNAQCWVFRAVGKRGVEKVIEIFEYARCRYGCDVFVLDSLMRLGVGPDDFAAQEAAVFELVSWAVEKGVHVHLVAHARKSDRSNGGSPVPAAEDVKGTSEIAANAANIIGLWRNRGLEDEIEAACRAANQGDATAREKLAVLIAQPTVVMNIAKQRNGDYEGKVGLWFDKKTYQYRSSRDDRNGRVYVPYDQRRLAAE